MSGSQLNIFTHVHSVHAWNPSTPFTHSYLESIHRLEFDPLLLVIGAEIKCLAQRIELGSVPGGRGQGKEIKCLAQRIELSMVPRGGAVGALSRWLF